MKIALVGNGEIFDFSQTTNHYDQIIAIDGGANHCRQLNITPHLIIGDLDSITTETKIYFANVPTLQIASQETTDLEKTLDYLKQKYKQEKIELDLYCFSDNKRPDHTFFNLSLSHRCSWPMRLISENYSIELVTNEKIIKGAKGKTASLLPCAGEVEGLTLKGFKWELNGENNYSISNIISSDEATVKIKKGKIILIIIHKAI